MPLHANEIQVGAIAYFDVNVLHVDADVAVTGDPVKREVTGNQFVCYKVNGNESYWTPLTGTYRYPRLPINPAWVTNRYGALAAGHVWLQDGKNTYHGPNVSFIAATANEAPFNVARPLVSAAGITEIHAAIQARGGAF